MKAWGGRFTESSSELLEQFNASIFFDRELYLEDIECSIYHSRMLANQKIITDEEADEIARGLDLIRSEIEAGKFEFSIKDEDIHMAIEKRLRELIATAGARVHTARSRNDQVAFDFRLWTQRENIKIQKLIFTLISTLLEISKKHTNTIMPGMTHLQHAQPVSFAYHLLAYISMFMRDFSRFRSSYERNNISPLGCAALAGTPHKIDRSFAAKKAGFDAVSLNCMDTVSDRDFAIEMLFNSSVLVMHMSRFCEELILWSSSEFGFVTISDRFTTGSSIMPNKKNPDVAELIRGKSGRIYGNLVGLLTVMKGLPLAYNKDTQEDKEGVFDTVKTIKDSLTILEAMIKETRVNAEAMKTACKKGHLTATDLADYLVEKGVPFRDAHHITGRAVALAESKGVDLSELSFSDLASVDSQIGEDAVARLDLIASMNARTSEGGTAVSAVQNQISKVEQWLQQWK